jgi:alpha-tubulin suppressor-like RCC1 family protein
LWLLAAVYLLLSSGMAWAQGGSIPWAWGDNIYGELGIGTISGFNDYRPKPQPASGLTGVAAVAAGQYHSLALKSDGTVWAWGDNFNGQLGNGTFTTTGTGGIATPAPVTGLTGVVAVAGGWGHSLAVKSDGTVWAWGYNGIGQLGDGTFTTGPPYGNSTPVQVVGLNGQGFLTGVVAVSAGAEHSLALKSDGTVWAWGDNGSGQLGIGAMYNVTPAPGQVLGPNGQGVLTGAIAVAAGAEHSLALKSDGTVWAWGFNGNGQLGDGGAEYTSSTPVQVSGLTGMVAVAAGEYHSLALKSDGTVWTWGINGDGELGIGTTSDSNTPVQVVGPNGQGVLTGVIAIAAGGFHSLAFKSDGTVWAWGWNDRGQLGNGTTGLRFAPGATTPAQVSGLTGVKAVAAGEIRTLALTSPTTLFGLLTLPGLVSTADIQTFSFTFRPTDGSAAFSLPTAVGPDGAFSLGGMPQKSYTLHIKGSRYLAKNLSIDLTNGSVSGLTTTLRPGDINNDNKVSIADLGLLADAFGSTPASPNWNASADLNGDGKVDILDLGLLADSFNKTGDP